METIMARGFITKRHNLTKETLLKIAAVGVLTIAASTSPYFLHQLVSAYFRGTSKKIARARAKKLREMEKRKLVDFRELNNGAVRIELTHKGKLLVRQYNLEEMRLKKPNRWDNQWRILIYDIPVSQRKASSAFRSKIKQLGLFPLQRSVWVSPYECLPEIEFLATMFDINVDHCICYFIARDIPHEKEIKMFFHL